MTTKVEVVHYSPEREDWVLNGFYDHVIIGRRRALRQALVGKDGELAKVCDDGRRTSIEPLTLLEIEIDGVITRSGEKISLRESKSLVIITETDQKTEIKDGY